MWEFGVDNLVHGRRASLKMESNQLMMRSALARLQYWSEQLALAKAANNHERQELCLKFVNEYNTLIEDMIQTALRPGTEVQP